MRTRTGNRRSLHVVGTVPRPAEQAEAEAEEVDLYPFSQTLPRGFDVLMANQATSNPFNVTTSEAWQWHYDSGQFNAPGPIEIGGVYIRGDSGSVSAFSYPSVEIVLAEASTHYNAASHVAVFANNIFRGETVRAARAYSGDAASGWVSLDLDVAFQYDPSLGRDFIIQIRKCGHTGPLMGTIDGQFSPSLSLGPVGGNRYGHLSNCAALSENFRNNEFVPVVRIKYRHL